MHGVSLQLNFHSLLTTAPPKTMRLQEIVASLHTAGWEMEEEEARISGEFQGPSLPAPSLNEHQKSTSLISGVFPNSHSYSDEDDGYGKTKVAGLHNSCTLSLLAKMQLLLSQRIQHFHL